MNKESEIEDLGTLIGNTGGLTVLVSLKDSFSVRRGGFVRILHKEERENEPVWVLGRIVSFHRENILYSTDLGSEVASVDLLVPSSMGENLYAKMEIIGYKDISGEIRIPRRPLDPGSKVYPVTFEFLKDFYQYTPSTSIKLGNLVGYEKGKNIVPVYIDINKIATEHLAILAMTGAGKSYTVGRIAELMVTRHNASVVIFDPHGEYGSMFRNGKLQFSDLDYLSQYTSEIQETQEKLKEMTRRGGGLKVYAPKSDTADLKYGGKYTELALRLDKLSIDEIKNILPDITEAQDRLLFQALRYWEKKFDSPRDPNDLLEILTKKFDDLKSWEKLSDEEKLALNKRSAAIIALRLRNLITESNFFWRKGLKPLDIREMVGRKKPLSEEDGIGRISVIDLQNLSKTSMQICVAIICNEILEAASDYKDPIRPVFVVVEEGHIFAPSSGNNVSIPLIKKIAAEGRKFGVGLCIVSQRPSHLNSDVTSQCNTIITMRIKNPDDQRFIRASSDYFSEVDINELPALSTGEALICGRAILASLLVKVGPKALVHGGEAPKVCEEWRKTLWMKH